MPTWLHIGDLHAAEEDEWASIGALGGIAGEARTLGDDIDLIYLPGDIANHAKPEQYRRVVVAVQDGETDSDQIEIDVGWSDQPTIRGRPGDHSASIGAWPSHGLMGARLGPNANGARW